MKCIEDPFDPFSWENLIVVGCLILWRICSQRRIPRCFGSDPGLVLPASLFSDAPIGMVVFWWLRYLVVVEGGTMF